MGILIGHALGYRKWALLLRNTPTAGRLQATRLFCASSLITKLPKPLHHLNRRAILAIIQRPCRHCDKLFPAKTSRALFCSDSCRTLHGRARRSTTKVVTIGRLQVTFEDCNPVLTQEALEAMVHDALTPEILEIIHNEQPTKSGETTHDTI